MSVAKTILETKNNLIEVINQSGLPVSISKYCLKDVLELVERQNDLELAVENRIEQFKKETNDAVKPAVENADEAGKPEFVED